ncbi:site-specific integrase, partial [Enterococcus durans]|nr:site-specific integrase [Enterococcus durans]
MENAIQLILAQMQSVLNSPQLKRLKTVLTEILPGGKTIKDDSELLPLFLTAKEVEGCSSKTIEYYRSTLSLMTETLAKPYTQIESDDLRKYLNDYEASRGSSKVTIDNIRRIMSSFFSWLEDEDYIVKSPVRRIHRVKTVQVAKEVLTDEDLETLRNVCGTKRDLA